MQRVTEIARKLGLPVIMTDPSGRDPMVILPLEQFEAMAGGETKTPAPLTHKPRPEPTKAPPMVPEINDFPLEIQDLAAMTATEATSDEVAADLSLEERFYLEPVEEGAEG